MNSLKKLINLSAVKGYVPRQLAPTEKKEFAQRLKHFTQQPKKLHLEYSFSSEKQYMFVLEKMNRIGLLADRMDHHPEWTLAQNKLVIDLNTHDIKNISEKDYLLAFITEQILYEDNQKNLLGKWNAL